jgi:uncharacterized protein (TIGR02118 family)
MIKVSVLYANGQGARFDHDYYRDRHVPLVAARLGAALKSYSIDKGLAGVSPGSSAPYVAMIHMFCESTEAFQSSFAPHAAELLADVANYTNLAPIMQISEVVGSTTEESDWQFGDW